MPVQSVINKLEQLIVAHETLLALSRKKTEILKAGSQTELQALLVQEQKQIRVLEKAEKMRQQVVDDWFRDKPLQEETATITGMLEIMTDMHDKENLEQAAVRLAVIIADLKRQEHLNQNLIRQSLQFIELSLDLMNPSIQTMNYGNKKTGTENKRSFFDSKA